MAHGHIGVPQLVLKRTLYPPATVTSRRIFVCEVMQGDTEVRSSVFWEGPDEPVRVGYAGWTTSFFRFNSLITIIMIWRERAKKKLTIFLGVCLPARMWDDPGFRMSFAPANQRFGQGLAVAGTGVFTSARSRRRVLWPGRGRGRYGYRKTQEEWRSFREITRAVTCLLQPWHIAHNPSGMKYDSNCRFFFSFFAVSAEVVRKFYDRKLSVFYAIGPKYYSQFK